MPAHHLRPTIVAEGCRRPRHDSVEEVIAPASRAVSTESSSPAVWWSRPRMVLVRGGR
jgi:hypothetical protein